MNNAVSSQPDKRAAQRMRTLKGARLVLANNMSTFECKVRNLSATGACVEMPSTLGVPARVTLKMDDGSGDQLCQVAWRTDKRLGLQFMS